MTVLVVLCSNLRTGLCLHLFPRPFPFRVRPVSRSGTCSSVGVFTSDVFAQDPIPERFDVLHSTHNSSILALLAAACRGRLPEIYGVLYARHAKTGRRALRAYDPGRQGGSARRVPSVRYGCAGRTRRDHGA